MEQRIRLDRKYPNLYNSRNKAIIIKDSGVCSRNISFR